MVDSERATRTRPLAVLAIVGASASGKTSVVRALDDRRLPGVGCFYFSSRGIPALEVVDRRFDSPDHWLAWLTDEWMRHIAANLAGLEVAIFEGQTRAKFVEAALARHRIRHAAMVLLDCTPALRLARLRGPRAQPELATPELVVWATRLREEAEAMRLPVYDTGLIGIEALADELMPRIERLRTSRG
jgi:hypothetical protein